MASQNVVNNGCTEHEHKLTRRDAHSVEGKQTPKNTQLPTTHTQHTDNRSAETDVKHTAGFTEVTPPEKVETFGTKKSDLNPAVSMSTHPSGHQTQPTHTQTAPHAAATTTTTTTTTATTATTNTTTTRLPTKMTNEEVEHPAHAYVGIPTTEPIVRDLHPSTMQEKGKQKFVHINKYEGKKEAEKEKQAEEDREAEQEHKVEKGDHAERHEARQVAREEQHANKHIEQNLAPADQTESDLHASKPAGFKDEFIGSIKKLTGKILGSESLHLKGETQAIKGEEEISAAKGHAPTKTEHVNDLRVNDTRQPANLQTRQ